MSSNKSCVRDGAVYDEVFPSGQNDLGTSNEERNLSATSPSTWDKDLGADKSVGDSSDGLIGAELPVQSIIGRYGFREFTMFPIWMVNDFTSTIKETHFKMLKAKHQILVNIPLRLPYKLEKCYYEGVKGVGVYEQMLKVELRLPLSSLHRRLLQYFGLAVIQISLNAWRVFLGVEVLYWAMSGRAWRLIVEEFFHCYRPAKIA